MSEHVLSDNENKFNVKLSDHLMFCIDLIRIQILMWKNIIDVNFLQ